MKPKKERKNFNETQNKTLTLVIKPTIHIIIREVI